MQIVIQAAVITGAPLYHERSVMIRFCYLLIRHHLNSCCCCCCFRLNSECCNTAKMPFLAQWVWWWGFLKNVHFKDFNCTITIREKKEFKKNTKTKKKDCFGVFFEVNFPQMVLLIYSHHLCVHIQHIVQFPWVFIFYLKMCSTGIVFLELHQKIPLPPLCGNFNSWPFL